MLTEVKVREVLGSLKEPFLHKTLAELNAIEEIKIKEEKNHVSVKLRLRKRVQLNNYSCKHKLLIC